MQLKLYGTGEQPKHQQQQQQQRESMQQQWLEQDQMEKSSSDWSRSSWLPIREIKTNRRCSLCNCCTICTISKVTHSAKTNTTHPHIHARVQYVSMTRILADSQSQSQSQSHSQSQFLSFPLAPAATATAGHVYGISWQFSHSCLLPSLFSFSFAFFRVFFSPSSRCIFLSLVTSALSCHSCSTCRVRLRVRVWVWGWVQSPQAAALVVLLKSPMISHKFFNFVRY